MGRSTWALIAVAVIGASTVVLAHTTSDWAAWVCYLPPSETSKPLAPGRAACIEYWVNRYQSLLGSVVAIIAAGVAWAGVSRQTRIGKYQIAVSMIPTLYDRYRLYFKYLVIFDRFSSALATFNKTLEHALRNNDNISGDDPFIFETYVLAHLSSSVKAMQIEFDSLIALQPFLDLDEKTRSDVIRGMRSMEDFFGRAVDIGNKAIPREHLPERRIEYFTKATDVDALKAFSETRFTQPSDLQLATIQANKHLETARLLANQTFET